MNGRVLRGSLTLGTADFSRRALLAVTVLVCARFLRPQAFGDYIFLLTFYQIFAVLGAAGLPSTLVRAVARDRRAGLHFAWASILARSAYVMPTAIVMYIVMRLLGLWHDYSFALSLLIMMMLVRGAAENIAFIFQGAEDQLSCAKVAVAQSAVTLVATIAICVTSKNLILLIAAHVLGGFTSALYGLFLLQKKTLQTSEGAKAISTDVRSLLRESHWLNAGAFIASAYNRSDVLLLRRLLSSEVVAIYAAPYRMLDVTQIIPSSLMATVLPSLCRKAETDSDTENVRTATSLLLVIAFAVIVLVTVSARWITLLFFGRGYEGSIAVLQVLVWAIVPMFWNFVLNSQLIANSFDRAIFYAAAVALAVNLGFNLLLIPKFGYFTCAAVTVMTEFALLFVNLHLVSRVTAPAWPENRVRMGMTMILIAAFCIFWTRGTNGHMLIAGVLLGLALLSLPVSWRRLLVFRFHGRARGVASSVV